MERLRRNSVYVALHGTLGRDLVFRHYTNKVVVDKWPEATKVKRSHRHRLTKKDMNEANHYAQIVMCSPELKALYEKYLQEGETVYRKAIKKYFEEQMTKRA